MNRRYRYISTLHLPDLNRFKPMVRGMNRIKGIISFGFIDHVIFEESSMPEIIKEFLVLKAFNQKINNKVTRDT